MVAGPGIEPGQEGYEPSELPLLKSRSNIIGSYEDSNLQPIG